MSDAGQFCCCDDATNCTDSISDLKTCMEGTCNTVLNVGFQPCNNANLGLCSLTSDVITISESFLDEELSFYFTAINHRE